MQWKDTSRRRKHSTNKEPDRWTYSVNGHDITVHRHIHYPEDTWLVTFRPYFQGAELRSKETEAAQREALVVTRLWLLEQIANQQNIVDQLESEGV